MIQCYLGKWYDYWLMNNFDELWEKLKCDFFYEVGGIDCFFEEVWKIVWIFLWFKEFYWLLEMFFGWVKMCYMFNCLKIGFLFFKYVLYGGDSGVKKGLSWYFKDECLYELFCSECDFFFCIFFIVWFYNYDYQNFFVGGSQVFFVWFFCKFFEFIEVLLSCSVSVIYVINGKVVLFFYMNRGKSYEFLVIYIIVVCDIDVFY